MLYRAIARIGYSNDNNAVHLTQDMRQILRGAGFDNSRTGTFETEAMELSEINACFGGILDELGELDDPSAPCLKHLWLYVDGPVLDSDTGDEDSEDEV